MRTRRSTTATLALASVLLFAPASGAQDPPPAPAPTDAVELPSARAVVDRFVEKAKLRATLDKHASAHITAEFELVGMGIEGQLNLYAAKPNRLYTELSLGPVGEVRQGHAGGVAWRIHPMLGTGLLEGMEQVQFLQQADWDNLLKGPERFESMETVARETFGGLDCHVVEFVTKAPEGVDAKATAKLRTHREYYSVETGLLVGVEATAASPMGETRTVSHISDYKEFGGSLTATKTTVEAAGQKYEIRFTGVEYDKVDPKVFDLPKAIQVLVEARRETPEPEPEPEGGGEDSVLR